MRTCRWKLHGVAVFMGALSVGCGESAPPAEVQPPSYNGVVLKLGAIDDPGLLVGVRAHRGEWHSSRGGEIAIEERPVAVDAAAGLDVLLFSGDRLGDLVDADILGEIPNASVMPPSRDEETGSESSRSTSSEQAPPARDAYEFMGVSAAYRDQVTRYGNARMALPYGASALVLVYRRDAFEREPNQKAAGEAAVKLEPPKTWDHLDALARFFHGRDWDGDGQPDAGIALALGPDAEGLANATYLARAASLGQHPDQFSFLFDSEKLTPRIATEPFVEALRGLVALAAAGPAGMKDFDAEAARKAFRSGKVAMLIDRAERAATWSHGKPVGVASLPGSEKVYESLSKAWTTPGRRNAPSYLPRGGGWLIGIRNGLTGKPLEAAIDLAKYLSSPGKADRIRAEREFPMLPFRTSQIGEGLPDPASAPDVDSRLWSEALGRTFAERPVVGLRIPGAEDYLSDLAAGRAAALAGSDPRAALEEVARAWTERTKTRGLKRQLWHYRRSLNLRATAPRPPERGT